MTQEPASPKFRMQNRKAEKTVKRDRTLNSRVKKVSGQIRTAGRVRRRAAEQQKRTLPQMSARRTAARLFRTIIQQEQIPKTVSKSTADEIKDGIIVRTRAAEVVKPVRRRATTHNNHCRTVYLCRKSRKDQAKEYFRLRGNNF